MAVTSRHFRFLLSFVYPSALGAALTWWFQAITARLQDDAHAPRIATLAFALWFILYHATWYWYLLDRAQADGREPPRGYGSRQLICDFLDALILMIAFAVLGLTGGEYDDTGRPGAYWAAIGLVSCAIVSRWEERQRAETLIGPFLVIIVALIGVFTQSSSSWTCGTLGLLYVALVAYAWKPGLFDSAQVGTP